MSDGLSSSPEPTAPLVPQPSLRLLLLCTILATILAYAVCLGLRLLEAPAWNQEQFQVQAEPIMATHDAYFFLAGAQETARPQAAHEPFFMLTRFFHAVSGMSYGNLGFWLPAFLAPLVVFPLGWLAWREGLPEAVLPMGIVAGGAMGFLTRTRLGYYDHDMLSLLLPVLFIALLFVFLERWLTLNRLARSAPENQTNPDFALLPVLWLMVGLSGWCWITFYPSGHPIALGITAMALGYALIATRGAEARSLIATAIGLIFLVSMNLVWGLVLAALTYIVLQLTVRVTQRTWPFWAILGGVWVGIFFMANLDAQFAGIIHQLGKYSPGFSESNQTARGALLPSVMQSVREARLLSPFFMAERSGGTWWFFAMGVIGYLYLCLKRPLYLLFAPLLILAAAAIRLGVRFTMYGGVPVGLGLGLGLTLLMTNLGFRQRVRVVIMAALALAAGILLWAQAGQLRPIPILPKAYAQTLLELRSLTPEQSRIWLWWDYGYAAQYYAQRASFGDGAMNSREYLYPLALAHATSSPMQAAQIIKMVTHGQMLAQQTPPRQEQGVWSIYSRPPLAAIREMTAGEARQYINDLARTRHQWPDDLPPQYLLLSWDNLSLARWITTFGNWDLQSGTGTAGIIHRVSGENKIDLEAGTLETAGNETIELDGFLTFTANQSTSTIWNNESGRHAVYNDMAKQFLLMDDTLFNSMLVQMLLSDPALFVEDFELVLDNAPWTRVYRVR